MSLTGGQGVDYTGVMGTTNESIAVRIGLSHSGVSRIRSGDRIPLVSTQVAIEDAYGWTVEEQARAIANGEYAARFDERVVHADVPAAS